MKAKEDLTQVEKDKIEIGFDADFKEIAKRSLESIPPNEVALWKWAGVYQQLQKGFFMIRLRIPGGLMTSEQLERAADLSSELAQDQLCITTRQCLQFHWIRKEDIHKILEGMKEVGILTKNACGDVTRNVVTCPLPGVCPHEEGDTLNMLQLIADDPEMLDQQRNLPRKHKISVAGCGRACGQTLMNCQGWHPIHREGRTGWRFYAGGGLGAKPYLGKLIFDWVPEDLVVDVARAVTEVFRRLGNRKVRALARLKIVVDRLGVKGFAQEVLQELSDRKVSGIAGIVVAESSAEIEESFLQGQAVIPQRQTGLYAVRAMIQRSELTSQEARRFAQWAQGYGDGTVVFTHRQNLVFRSVAFNKTEELLGLLKNAGYRIEGFEHLPDMVACVGTTVCNLAVSDTPNTYRSMMEKLTSDADWWKNIGPLRINMNGCPNSCGQHAVADIGLRGLRKRTEQGSEEGYSIFVGGSLSGAGHLGEYVCDATASQVIATVKKILTVYLQKRLSPEEYFGVFSRRVTGAGMKDMLGSREVESDFVQERNQKYQAVFQATIDSTREQKRDKS